MKPAAHNKDTLDAKALLSTEEDCPKYLSIDGLVTEKTKVVGMEVDLSFWKKIMKILLGLHVLFTCMIVACFAMLLLQYLGKKAGNDEGLCSCGKIQFCLRSKGETCSNSHVNCAGAIFCGNKTNARMVYFTDICRNDLINKFKPRLNAHDIPHFFFFKKEKGKTYGISDSKLTKAISLVGTE